MRTVRCAVCGKVFTTVSGMQKCCSRSCSGEYHRKKAYDYWIAHKAERKAWYEANKDTILERQAEYDKCHREQRRRHCRKYSVSEKGKAARERAKEKWRLLHPLKGRKPALPKEEAKRRRILGNKAYRAQGREDFLNNVVSTKSLSYIRNLDVTNEWKARNRNRVLELHQRDRSREKLRDVASMWMRAGVVS